MGDWFPREESRRSGRSRWRGKWCRTSGGVVWRTIAAPDRESRRYEFDSMVGVRGEGYYAHLDLQSHPLGMLSASAHGSGSDVEENSLAFDIKESRHKGDGANQEIEEYMGEEILKEMEIRHSPPGVIAKLMGLDLPPPPQVVRSQNRDVGGYLPKSSSFHASFRNKYASIKEDSCHMKMDERSEFKDVFEVMKSSEVAKDRNQLFFRKNSVGSKERCNHINGEDFDKHFPKILKEPNPLFRKHLRDLKCSSAIFKSANDAERERALMELTPGKIDRSFKQTGTSLSHTFSRSRYSGRTAASTSHNQIVLLKPSLEKAGIPLNSVSLSRKLDDFHFLYRRESEKRKPGLFHNIETRGAMIKGSREIARDVTKQMKHSTDSGTKEFYNLRTNGNAKNKLSSSLYSTDVLQSSSSRYSDYSTKPSAHKEGKERLFEQCKRPQQFEAGNIGKGARTLAEMFALSDSEKSTRTSGSHYIFTPEKLDGYIIHLPKSISPTVLSTVRGQSLRSMHGFGGSGIIDMPKYEDSKHKSFLDGKLYQRAKGLSKSSSHERNKFHSYTGGDRKNSHARDVHLDQEILMNRVHGPISAKSKRNLPEFSTDDSLIAESKDAKKLFATDKGLVSKNAALAENSTFSGNGRKIIPSSQHEEVRFPTHSDETDSVSTMDSKKPEQPSPVSVLESPLEVKKSNSKSFARMCLDLQELQLQLDLLKFNSESSAEDPEIFVSSDEDSNEESDSLHLIENILEAFRDEEDRDYSYLLDILISSGVHGANLDRIHKACHSPSRPAGATVFESLEKKYKKIVKWSRSERMLLFDHVNTILSEVLAPCMDLHPWVKLDSLVSPMWGPEGLVEKVWQILVRRRKELGEGDPESKVLDTKWLDLGDGVDMIGSEIERMLKDELLEELVSEFSLG
ncbi:uncharacterized protein LOC109728175 [Ananas comosus]|uniref:Uncharacterized protein LOC109728175 n=1 Tax=Ananas comosus TaxID=4615 RepID=A0A6P5H257_ANACO|nr:uncharacterized protein LOC109728175 [Ananas comosus]